MPARLFLVPMLAIALFCSGLSSLRAQEPDVQEQGGQKQAQDLQAAVDAMQKVIQPGASNANLAKQAILHIPKGANFVRQPEAGQWAAASGYGKDNDLVGIVVPSAEENWIIFIDYHPGVRVVDSDAHSWDLDVLLANLKASTEQGNVDRHKLDQPEIEVKRWLEKPNYDPTGHKLIWAVISPEKGADEEDGSGNVHAYALGRDSYFELTLVSPAGEIASRISVAKAVLAGIEFNIGLGYEDEVSSRDAKERSITSLISSGVPSTATTFLDYLGTNWILSATGLIAVIVIVLGLVSLVQRRV